MEYIHSIKTRLNTVICALIALAVFFSVSEAEAVSYKNFDFEITGKVGARYDDNITYAKTGKIDDMITDLDLGLSFLHEEKDWDIDLDLNMRQDIFLDNTKLNNLSEDCGLAFTKEFGKYDRMRLIDNFLHADEPRGFDAESEGGIGRYSYYTNNFNMSYEKDLSQELTLLTNYSHGMFIPETDSGYNDSYINSGGLSANYIWSSHTIFSIIYDITYRNVEDVEVHSLRNTLLLGVRQYFTEQLYADLRSGIDFIRAYDKKLYKEPNISLAVTNEFSETSSLTLRGEKLHDESYYRQSLGDLWRFSANYNNRVSERLNLTGGASLSRREFSAGKKEDYFGGNLGLSYDITEDFQGTMSYSYSRGYDNVGGGYTKNVTYAGVNYSF